MNFPNRNVHVAYQKLGEETIILDTKIGKQVHKLNEVASYIWSLCDGTNSLEVIKDSLINEYQIDEAEAQKDLMEFITEMKNKKLIE